jgi:hypothetical protein
LSVPRVDRCSTTVVLLCFGAGIFGAACFPDPPPCVGTNLCPDEIDGEHDTEATHELPDTSDIGRTSELPDTNDTETAPELSETGDTETALELSETADTGTAPELPDSDAGDGTAISEIGADTGPEIEPKECDELDCALEHRECIERSGSSDASCGACLVGYRLAGGVCVAVLSCDDIDCDAAHRECISGDAETDATCGACVPGYSPVAGDCIADAPTPTNVVATTDRASEVEITWSGVPNATGYQVFRCDQATCGGGEAGWFALNDDPIAALSYLDETVEVPALPGAPVNLEATTDSSTMVSVTWSSVAAPAARTYRYRVVAIGPGGPSPASSQALGRVAERPVTGYEIAIEGDAWASLGDVTSYHDAQAPAPTITAPTASASQGVHEAFVRLGAAGGAANDGAPRRYAVRAMTAAAAGPSSSASGHRPAGALTLQWERSAGQSPDGFSRRSSARRPRATTTRGRRRMARRVGIASSPARPARPRCRAERSLAPASTQRASFRRVSAPRAKLKA